MNMYFDFTSFFFPPDNRIYVFTTDEKRNASPELVALYEAELAQLKQPEAMETDDTGTFIIWNYFFLFSWNWKKPNSVEISSSNNNIYVAAFDVDSPESLLIELDGSKSQEILAKFGNDYE